MAKKKTWTEVELILTFGLERDDKANILLNQWLDVKPVILTDNETPFFEQIWDSFSKKVDFWNEETLKMRFISPLLSFFIQFGDNRYDSFFDETISATVNGIYLHTEVDFMLAKGLGDIVQTPYFHFQEYKRSRKTPPEPMAQLIEAFLIAQEKNKNGKPLYGLTIVGRYWHFVVMQDKKYGVSRVFDATQREDLLKIIAVLRKFKVILETTLLD
jgi:hypothetical protein